MPIETQNTARTKTPGFVAVVVGITLLAIKFLAYSLTNSQAIFSDALESIVNVLAALFTFFILRISISPADDNHPYGHGKSEYFSAAFEGGMVFFAAGLIIVQGVEALFTAHHVESLSSGIALIFGAGVANLLLGFYLVRSGTQQNSASLVASGHHVISDFWSSAAVLGGLVAVRLTGIDQLDPVIAIGIGIYLATTGFTIVKKSIGGLLDEQDEDALSAFATACDKVHKPGVIAVHHARMMRAGHYHIIDAHVVVPEFWTITEAHDATNDFAEEVLTGYPARGEIHFHIDPCRRKLCEMCDLNPCVVRTKPFIRRAPMTAKEVTAAKASAYSVS